MLCLGEAACNAQNGEICDPMSDSASGDSSQCFCGFLLSKYLSQDFHFCPLVIVSTSR